MLLRSWLSRWISRTNAQARRTRRQPIRPVAARVQSLEPRVLLTVTPVSGEFQVNTFATGNQDANRQAVAMDDNGNFVVVWSSIDGAGYGIFAQRYNAAGVAQGTEFQINSTVLGNQTDAAVAMDAVGNFVVTWTSSVGDGNQSGIFARRFNAAGTAQGNDFQVNTYTTNAQLDAAIAMDDGGNFVVSWTGFTQGLVSTYGVFAQRYDAAGVAQGSEFLVNTTTTGQHEKSLVAVDADGDFVITWTGDSDGDGTGIYGQRYNAAGVAQGGEFQVNTYTTFSQSDSVVAMDADGDFVVSWFSRNSIFGRRYNAAGVAQGAEFLIDSGNTRTQIRPAIAMDTDGDFVVAWATYFQDGNQLGVFARQFNAAGVAQTDEFQVNTYTMFNQSIPAVGMDADGDFVVTWQFNTPNPAQSDVFARRFSANQAPVIANEMFSIAENRPAGYVVGTVVASDPNPGQTLSYAITGGNTNGQFAINPTTGQLTVVSPTLNFEALNQYNLTVRVTDNAPEAAMSSTATVTINIIDLNEAPTFLAPTTFAVAQNKPIGFVVGDINTVDPEGNTVTYSIVGGDPSNQFAIDPATGEITIAAALDAGVTPQYLLQVQAQDDGTPANSRTQVVTVNVTPPNDPPVFGAPPTFTIAENRPVGYVVGTVTATDPDMNSISYSIVGGNTDGQFVINPTTGQITVAKGTVNFETIPQYVLQVRATDNANPPESATQNVTININDLNEPPAFVPPTTFSIAENRPVGFLVGQVNAIDPEGDPVTYAIVGGDAKQQFSINPTTGVITVAKATIDFEINPFYLLQVQAADDGNPAATRTQTIRVNITNLNEAPVFVGPTTFNYAENQPVGSFVGDVNASDPESNALTYSITGGNQGEQFAIDETTGVITLAKGSINYEATSQFVLQIRVQDNGNPSQSRTQNYTINITDVNEPPIFAPPTTFNVAENRPVGTVVGSVNVVDPENRPMTFTITGGNTNNVFAINPNTGQITVAKATLDFESLPVYTLQVKVVDQGSPQNSVTQAITINVTNLNEAPNFLTPTSFTIQENRPNGTVVGSVQAVDPEGNTIAFSITGGNTGNAFAINSSTGQITVANGAALDFETTPQFQLQVRALDNGSPANSRTQTITINLTDIAGARVPNPAPTMDSLTVATGTSTGEQTAANSQPSTAPAKSATPNQSADLVSFTLYEPWTADESTNQSV